MDTATLIEQLKVGVPRAISRAITLVENGSDESDAILTSLDKKKIDDALIIGITGFPGAGKSTLVDRLITHYRAENHKIGVIAIDPTSPLTGGALLGDRIRMMNHSLDGGVFVRSMASRGRLGGLCASAGASMRVMAAGGYSPILIETVGVGQSEMDIVNLADVSILVLAPGLGDEIQAMKAGLLEVADIIVVNKADLAGAQNLMKDMEEMVHMEKDRRFQQVCLTTASEGKGITELAAIITNAQTTHLTTGERHRRREESRKKETLDWAIEMIRPKLANKLKKVFLEKAQDPRTLAKLLVESEKD